MAFDYEKYYKDILSKRNRSDIIQRLKKEVCLECIYRETVIETNKMEGLKYIEYFAKCPFEKCYYENE